MQTFNDLACPQCQGPLNFDLVFEREDEDCGYLDCPNCHSSTPLVLGFPLFTETSGTENANKSSRLHELATQMAPPEKQYEKYIAQKMQRDILEVYAAFQPFNESTRSLYPLVDALRTHLQPGDLIVDTWCRTGWSGELLAALFPQQRVLSLWEGNSSVLGYRGFYFWLNSRRRSKNLDIIFSPPNAPFPIRSDCAMFVHAYDSLHRNPLKQYSGECLRMAKNRGILCFPHVHLSNNQPDPFFERGGEYRHGKEYREYFHRRLEQEDREPLVLSEISLFKKNSPAPLQDEADTAHYNGVILIAQADWYRQSFASRLERELTPDSRLIANPLVRINPLIRQAFLDKDALNGNVDYLLDRHPMYEKHIKSKLPMELTCEQLALIAVAESGANLGECALQLHRPLDDLLKTAQWLVANEIFSALPISKTAFNLQQFHANNHTLFLQDFLSCWQPLLDHSPQNPLLTIQDQPLSVEEVSQVMEALCRYFQECDKRSAGRLAMVGELNAERLMALMAGWCMGYTADLCDESDIPPDTSIVVSDGGVPGEWKNITLTCDEGKFVDFWTVVEEFADPEGQLPVRPCQASVLNVAGNKYPWYRVSSMLTPWLAESNNPHP